MKKISFQEIQSMSEQELLDQKIKHLDLKISGQHKDVLKVLFSLLNEKNILWKPEVWISDEWFSPDGVAGFAIPFTLCHPKLIALEKKYLGFCEGSNKREFFKLACHESGHAIDNAYRLRKKKQRQQIFGLSSKAYPSSYKPNPQRRDFVQHLDDFYAQAHPDEDWAETFAVWLTKKNWKHTYKSSPALKKLNYLDSVMFGVQYSFNFSGKRNHYNSFKNDNRTLRQYLLEKRKMLKLNRNNYYTNKVSKEFCSDEKQQTAFSFIQKNKSTILKEIGHGKSKTEQWVLSKCLDDLKEVCKKKNYRLKYTEHYSKTRIKQLVLKNSNKFQEEGRTRIYM